MTESSISKTEKWYEESYSRDGFSAQRLYPNEEFLRFMGRNFFSTPKQERQSRSILEIGCGSCPNLWVVAHEGFSAFGIDLSTQSIELGQMMLAKWGVSADLKAGSMTDLPYSEASFDAVADVFSAYCLNEKDFEICLHEVHRVLSPGGKFFSYTPSKMSDAFKNHEPSELIDASTLNGIHRESSPFYGNYYPFRFVLPDEYQKIIEAHGFKVDYLETVSRSYCQEAELFQHVVIEATKL